MALANPQLRNTASDDELDNILDGIVEGRHIANSGPGATQPERPTNRKSDKTGALGVDEEIIVTKKRAPIPKLDDERLLSAAGIPRLQKISKERLRFKGKGHEYGDIARMLNMYQLWLDDLYPRAKFADALTIIEKVGHSKRMQIMRKDWIDEGKPKRAGEREDDDMGETTPNPTSTMEEMEGQEHETVAAQSGLTSNGESQGPRQPQNGSAEMAGDDPDEDELDALLAESAEPKNTSLQTLPSRPAPTEEDLFADEMEAMADIDGFW